MKRVAYTALASDAARPHTASVFMVNEEDAAAIRAAYHEGGEFSAAVELRRRFPGIADNDQARLCARSIASWAEPPDLLPSVTRLRPRKRS